MKSKGTQLYIYLFSPKLPSHSGCHIILRRVPCAVRSLLVIHFKYSRNTFFFLIRKRNWLLVEEGRKYKFVWYLWYARCCYNRTPQSQRYYLYLGKILFSEVEVSLWSIALIVCKTGTRKGSGDIWHPCSITVTHLIMRPLFDP